MAENFGLRERPHEIYVSVIFAVVIAAVLLVIHWLSN